MLPRIGLPFLSLMAVLLGLWGSSAGPADEPKKAGDEQAAKELLPRLATLRGDAVPLSQALQELRKQTGTEVLLRRPDSGDDPQLKLKLDQVTFWQALEEIAKQADLRIHPYERDRKIALVPRPYVEVPISFDGLFRVAVKKLMGVRLLDEDVHYYAVSLEVAWEPRFQAFLLEAKPEALVAQDAKGRTLEPLPTGRGQLPVSDRTATEVELHFAAPPRSAPRLGLLKGSVSVIGAARMLDFSFDRTARDKEQAKTQEGVSVKLREFDDTDPEIWTIGFRLDYPPEGPKFESFQSWVANNEIFLENAEGKRFAGNGGYEVVDQSGSSAIIRYRFVEDRPGKLLLGKGKAGNWKVVYRTPGRIIQVPVRFEFKDVPLP